MKTIALPLVIAFFVVLLIVVAAAIEFTKEQYAWLNDTSIVIAICGIIAIPFMAIVAKIQNRK